MRIISFYTPDGEYLAFADKLRASCERFEIPLHLEELPSKGTWGANIALKPKFVYDRLLEYEEPIVWLDVDCEVIQRPRLLEDTSHDFMIYNWFADKENHCPYFDPKQLMCSGGVFLVNYTPAGLQLMYRWIEQCKKHAGKRTDPLLDIAWKSAPKNAKPRSFWLPRAYNRMDGHWPDVEPVINHVYRDGEIFGKGANQGTDIWVNRGSG